jgi:hypothetical protein
MQDRLLLHKMHYQDEIRDFEATVPKEGAQDQRPATKICETRGLGNREASFFVHAQSRYPFVIEHQSSPEEIIALLRSTLTATALR